MHQRIPTQSANFFVKDIITKFKYVLGVYIAYKRLIRSTEVLMEITEDFLVPQRFVIVTKTDKAYLKVKRILEDLGLRREIPSCRHYLLGTVVSVKIEQPSECEIYENYKRSGKWEIV
ncbi:hypothetical protein DRN34_02205 [Thermococci archaeon]|nr:MAG: hypothetical protein DRN34_02205 [Thermococci archaeon]